MLHSLRVFHLNYGKAQWSSDKFLSSLRIIQESSVLKNIASLIISLERNSYYRDAKTMITYRIITCAKRTNVAATSEALEIRNAGGKKSAPTLFIARRGHRLVPDDLRPIDLFPTNFPFRSTTLPAAWFESKSAPLKRFESLKNFSPPSQLPL